MLKVTSSVLALALAGSLALTGCSYTPDQAVGQYYREKDNGMPLALDLKQDGTFGSYNGDQTGTWHLVHHTGFANSVELDGTNDFGKYAEEYRLTRHNGAFCIETHIDYEYWCRRR